MEGRPGYVSCTGFQTEVRILCPQFDTRNELDPFRKWNENHFQMFGVVELCRPLDDIVFDFTQEGEALHLAVANRGVNTLGSRKWNQALELGACFFSPFTHANSVHLFGHVCEVFFGLAGDAADRDKRNAVVAVFPLGGNRHHTVNQCEDASVGLEVDLEPVERCSVVRILVVNHRTLGREAFVRFQLIRCCIVQIVSDIDRIREARPRHYAEVTDALKDAFGCENWPFEIAHVIPCERAPHTVRKQTTMVYIL
jgi:hypothetical protein